MKGTIHIFGYGESQIISDSVNFKANVKKFTKLQAVIDYVKSKKPTDKTPADYHAINIFGDMRVDYIAKESTGGKPNEKDPSSFSIKFSDLDSNKLNALIDEFTTLSKG